jgi:hypothetical protein
LVLFLITLYPLVWFAMELKHRGALYYGGKSGFWEYTGGTLTKLYTGYYSPIWAIGLTILFGLLVLGYLAINRNNLLRLANLAAEPSTLWAYLLVGSLSAIFATRYLLNVNFPEDRAAMYLYPYLIGSVVFVSNQWWEKTGKFLMLIPVVGLFYFPINFVQRINVHKATFSMEERAPQAFFDVISTKNPIAGYPVIVGGAHTQELCWFYMNYHKGANQGKLHYYAHLDTLCDFQIADIRRTKPPRFDQLYTQLNENPENNLNLYERKSKLARKLVLQRTDITNWNHSNEEFFGFLEGEIPDSMKGKPLFVGLRATVHSPKKPFVAAVVVSQKNQHYQELHQEVLHLNWLRNEWDNSKDNLRQGIMIPAIYPETKYLVVYLWNQHQVDFLVHDGTCELFMLKFIKEQP